MTTLCILLVCCQAPAKKPVTPEMLYENKSFLAPAPTITWLPDGQHWLETGKEVQQKVEALSGKSEDAFDAAKFRKSLETVPDLEAMRVRMLVRGVGLKANVDRSGALVTVKNGTYHAFFNGDTAVKLAPNGAEFLTFAPDGKTLAFVKGGNLFSVDVATKKETQLTTDGGGDILNGKADWVYEEEIFDRNGQAFWWSPDSKSIAFLRFDDSPVKKFTIVRASGEVETINYPKAGEPNPTVKLFTVKPGDKPVELIIAGDPKDTLVSRIGWTPKNDVYAYVQNRTQTWLDFTVWHDARPSVMYRAKTEAWISDYGEPTFLPDGSFVILSDTRGERTLEHRNSEGELLHRFKPGKGQVREIIGIRENNVWCLTNEHDRNGTRTSANQNGATVEIANLKDQKWNTLTNDIGTHNVQLAPQGELYLDRFSSPTQPPATTLNSSTLKKIRKLESPLPKDMDGYSWGKYERVAITTKTVSMEGSLMYPPDFDPTKKYPVWMMTYAGPQTPTIKDAWSPRLFDHVLANMGIVVFRVDPRPANGFGVKHSWPTYKQLGVEELKDLETAARWIARKPWCDESRIGLSGHSFGGYITAYALTHSKLWCAGIAGAPVTDWRLYDSIYTERYMGLPSENKKGYDDSSCILAAKNLHGQLLLIHGLIDDNVHIQNTMQFAEALQKANKPFELMIYPNARHPIFGRHYYEAQINFIRKTMLH